MTPITTTLDFGIMQRKPLGLLDGEDAPAASNGGSAESRPPQPPVLAGPAQPPRVVVRSRDRYIDSLRAFALLRVVIYHVFGWAWLTIVFPSMPIMFALAGSLVASSLDRSPGNPWRVLKKRTWRLLPPLWMLGLIAIPLMLAHRWTFDADLGVGEPLSWRTMLFWLVPISDPPGSAWGADWTVALWYLRAYLWFLLLSPATLWLFRRWPLRTLAVPFVGLLAATVGLWPLTGRGGDVLLTTMAFGGCWMLGYAHHDNIIRAMPLRKIVPLAVALMAGGLGWALTHQDPISGYDLDNIPLANSLWGMGAVLLLLRFYPDFSWLARRPVLDKAIMAINSRAMTIYLWNNPAIFLAIPLAGLLPLTRSWDTDGLRGGLQQLVVSVLLVIAAIFIFGWVEDLAARRSLRINPWPRGERRKAELGTARIVSWPQVKVLSTRRRLGLTAALIAGTAGASALALAGTQTPAGNSADAPPRTAVQPRLPRLPVANLARPDGGTGLRTTGGNSKLIMVTDPSTTQKAPAPSTSSPSTSPTTGRSTAPTSVLPPTLGGPSASPPTAGTVLPPTTTRPTTRPTTPPSTTPPSTPPATTPPTTTPPTTTPPTTTPPTTTPPTTTPPTTTPPTTTPPTTTPPTTTPPATTPPAVLPPSAPPTTTPLAPTTAPAPATTAPTTEPTTIPRTQTIAPTTPVTAPAPIANATRIQTAVPTAVPSSQAR